MDQPIEITYSDVVYRRNPESQQRSHRVYFTARRDDERGVLHRDVYVDNHGPIPDGWHVHHIDENPFNNAPENLTALSPQDHRRIHPGHHDLNSAEWLAHLASIRPLAAEWHSSEEGLEWHSEHGRETWTDRERVIIEAICANCSGPVESYVNGRGDLRFCSRRCINAHNEKSGRYLTPTPCPICGSEFGQRRGRPATCGQNCGSELRSRNLKARDASFGRDE